MDWTPTCQDTVTLQGDYYRGVEGIITGLIPRDETDESLWRCVVVRLWNLDRQDPR